MRHQADYQGWKNYETWAVMLYLDNDQGEYEYWYNEVIPELKNNFQPQSKYDEARHQLADLLKYHFEEWMEQLPEIPSPFMELLNGGFSEVDWREMAEHMLEYEG